MKILFIILICLSVFLIFAVILAFMRNQTAKAQEEKNAVLVKANLDKDRLISLLKHNMADEAKCDIASIISDVESMPKINLTKREVQIAELGISQRTVETHKNNLFRKLGINNTVELMRYMQWYNKEQ